MTAAKKVCSVAALVVAGGFAYMHLSGPNGVAQLISNRQELRALEQEIGTLKKDNQRRRARLLELTTESGIESAIRDRTGKVKPNEKLLRLPEELEERKPE